MQYQKLFALLIITASIIVAANYFTDSRAPQTKLEKVLLFPKLTEKINDVSRIEIRSDARSTVILEKQDEQWRLSSADGYPAQFDKIRGVVIGLSQLKIADEKTNNPKRYATLHVEDIDTENANSVLLTLTDHSATPLASLIIGKPRTGGHRPGLYVRKPDATSALLVEGELRVGASNEDWYQRNIVNIPVTRIQSVTLVDHAGENLRVYRETKEEEDFKLAEGETTAPQELLSKLGTFLEDMRSDNVQTKEGFEFSDDNTKTATLTTFDGLIITVKNTVIEDHAFAHFSFAVDEERISSVGDTAENTGGKTGVTDSSADVKLESQRLNKSLGNWVYQIPNFKFKILDIDITAVPK